MKNFSLKITSLFFSNQEPGYVKNVRYIYEKKFNFLIKCDEPEDSNGDLNVRLYFFSKTELFQE